MLRYLARRLVALIPMLLVVTFVSFAIYQLAPGDPVMSYVPREALDDPHAIARIRQLYGLDKPWYVQYLHWLTAVFQGDFGRSLIDAEPVIEKLGRGIPWSLRLSVVSFFFSTTLAIVLGVISATQRYSWVDHLFTFLSFGFLAIPSFWLGLMLMLLFSVALGWLPATGAYTLVGERTLWDTISRMIMPVLVVSLNSIAGLSRYMRSSLLEVIRLDYIRTARAKGLSAKIVIYKHAMRNALIPVITILGLSLTDFIDGALIAENLFAWPGMGRITVQAVFQKDYPVIMGANLLFAFTTVVGNLLADLTYALVDPRVTYT